MYTMRRDGDDGTWHVISPDDEWVATFKYEFDAAAFCKRYSADPCR